MRTSKIELSILLDNDNVPESISWAATDKPDDASSTTRCMSLALWEQDRNNTLRIDLWTKDMTVEEMRRFLLQHMAGLADTFLNATGDQGTYVQIKDLSENLAQQFLQQERQAQAQSGSGAGPRTDLPPISTN